MPDICVTCPTANPALLLIEPNELSYSERAAQLEESPFRVTRADALRSVYQMRTLSRFNIVVISDRIGFLSLRDSAQMVRSKWPQARILILGTVPSRFDDHLYDETMLHASCGDTFLAVVQQISDRQVEKGIDFSISWSNSRIEAPHLQSQLTPGGGPTQPLGLAIGTDHQRDWPETAARRPGSRHVQLR